MGPWAPPMVAMGQSRLWCHFSCVSRGWRALVSHQSFLAAHKVRHADPLMVGITSFKDCKDGDLWLVDMDGGAMMPV